MYDELQTKSKLSPIFSHAWQWRAAAARDCGQGSVETGHVAVADAAGAAPAAASAASAARVAARREVVLGV